MSAATLTPGQGNGAAMKTSYWALVWEQLAGNRVAMFGLGAVGLFVFMAVYAPLFSLDQPLVWSAEGELRFPWFGALFNRLLFENAVDIFFNLAMLLSPVCLGLYIWLQRRHAVDFGLVRGIWLRRFAAVQLLLFVLLQIESFGPVANPLHYTERVVDWKEEMARLDASPDSEGAFAIFPMRSFHYSDTDPVRTVQPPSGKHWFGTDTEGRDVFARMLYGTRVSLTIGIVAVSIYVVIGIFLGAIAGYFGGLVDSLVSRAIEVMICFPSFFLILTLAAFVEERSIFHVMVIIGITSWTGVARLIRAEFLRHKALEYAQAALALGVSRRRIIFRHILPNAISPVLVTATFGVASAILTESGLAFLGLGDISSPSWGMTLSAGRIEGKLWLILLPGLAIFLLVSVLNLVGEGLRDALDPKLRS
ncbi:MAG: ABC transporter permease [Myxococcota bacterium]|nr:ABC transporter permease [Myxococcota bacterium]